MTGTEATHVTSRIDHLFRTRAGQIVAWLTRLLGPQHLELAEEAAQEALLKALQHWPTSGVPENPSGWLFRVAHNAALDALRRNTSFAEKAERIAREAQNEVRSFETQINLDQYLRDDELRMVFLCCHPAISRDARVALSLKTVGGFSVREVARAFLAEENTIAQRLVRAKRQIRELELPFEIPGQTEIEQRLDSVLEVIYLMFNEGYSAHSGEELIRKDVCLEALRLAQLVAASRVATPKAHALTALLAFQGARLPARVDERGEMVLLEDQDRTQWDRQLLALAFHHFSRCAEGDIVSEYHVQAAIAATHARATSAADTDWPAILTLYDDLLALNPSPVVALNRAVALAKVAGSAEGLRALDPLLADDAMRNYYLLPAVRGRLLLDLGESADAAECFRKAMALPCSEPERRFLQRQLDATQEA